MADEEEPGPQQNDRDGRGAFPGTGTHGDATIRVSIPPVSATKAANSAASRPSSSAAARRCSVTGPMPGPGPAAPGDVNSRLRPRPADSGSNIEPFMVLRASFIAAGVGCRPAAEQRRRGCRRRTAGSGRGDREADAIMALGQPRRARPAVLRVARQSRAHARHYQGTRPRRLVSPRVSGC